MTRKACIIGAGPNGLAAAIVLAQAGLQVDVFEAETIPGGGARTMELTLPGFLHDFGSAVHPFAVGSPFFSSLPLRDYGLEWIHSPAPLVHPLDDGTAVVLERDFGEAAKALGQDGRAWRRLMEPYAERWNDLASGSLRPLTLFPRHPFLMASFGLRSLHSARMMAYSRFRNERTRALFAGIAAHSVMSLNDLLSGPFGLLIAISAHAVGWPIPRGGAQALTNALCGYLAKLGGKVHTAMRVETLTGLPGYDLILCDVTPKQILRIAGHKFSSAYKDRLAAYSYGPGVFKVDYALRDPIPWRAKECLRAATVHLGGSFEEIAASEEAMATGHHAERPFMILSQPSLFDPTRAPAGKHTAWVYAHVPNGSKEDMLPRIEAQIERFAPGFRDRVLARRAFSPADLEAMDANLIGGDIGGGAMTLRQFLFRPTRRHYATSFPGLYLCSSSTPPGGGVHGMCGYHAAREALATLK
ncbi:MAG TPA: NAD(P)/FAD-dependent oxidoreductase [Terriglobales bacterium]|nr:NAD(P)/FAD-dependent oxidoreductase [Terriglobales bacterium]